MMKKLFRVQDLDFLSFYDVSTQMSLFFKYAAHDTNKKYRAFFYPAHRLSWGCIYSLFVGTPAAG